MAEYNVGYCNPPKEYRFKKGVCANPKGRGKRIKPPYERVIEEVMSAPITFQEGGRQKRATRAEVLVRKHVSAALNGDPESAMRLLQLHKHAVRYAVEGPTIIEFNGLPDRDRGSTDRKAAHMAGLLGYPTEKEESEK
jgi:Family of unknown function (DUF5681)